MSWSDPCSTCDNHRADCDCKIITIKIESVTKLLPLPFPNYHLEQFIEDSKIRCATISKLLLQQLIIVENKMKALEPKMAGDFVNMIYLVKLLNTELLIYATNKDNNLEEYSIFREYVNFLHARYFKTDLYFNLHINNYRYDLVLNTDLKDFDETSDNCEYFKDKRKNFESLNQIQTII